MVFGRKAASYKPVHLYEENVVCEPKEFLIAAAPLRHRRKEGITKRGYGAGLAVERTGLAYRAGLAGRPGLCEFLAQYQEKRDPGRCEQRCPGSHFL